MKVTEMLCFILKKKTALAIVINNLFLSLVTLISLKSIIFTNISSYYVDRITLSV